MPINNRDIMVIEKILKYCDEINYAHNEYRRSFEAFKTVPTYRNAVSLCLMQIGELTNKLSEGFKEKFSEIPWKAIRGMRNVVAHEYGSIDEVTVWETAESNTEALRLFCLKILNEKQ